jgi:hypothetical protein
MKLVRNIGGRGSGGPLLHGKLPISVLDTVVPARLEPAI